MGLRDETRLEVTAKFDFGSLTRHLSALVRRGLTASASIVLLLLTMASSGMSEEPANKSAVASSEMPHSNPVTSVAFSPNGKLLITGSEDNSLKLWDVATGRVIRTFVGHSNWVTSVAFSPDAKRVVSGGADNSIRIWDVSTGRAERKIDDTDMVMSVAFSPDGRSLLSGGGGPYGAGTLKLWDASNGQIIRSFAGHSKQIYSVAFSSDGSSILSGSKDYTLKLWRVADGNLTRTFDHADEVTSVAFSRDGARLVSGSVDRVVRLWDSADGQPNTRIFRPPKLHRFCGAFGRRHSRGVRQRRQND